MNFSVHRICLGAGALLLSSCQPEVVEVSELEREVLPVEDAPPEISTEQRMLFAQLNSPAENVLFSWKLPEGWLAVPVRSNFYLASFEVPGGIRCDIASTGGGVEPNLQRWYAQFSQVWPEQGLEALETIQLAGADGYFMQLTGRYQPAGQGRPARNNTGLLGAAAPAGQQVLTVKMTGSADLVAGQEENFRAFCASLQRNTED